MRCTGRWALAVLAAALAVEAPPAAGATLDVRVLGRDGRPLADSAVFLESREARAAVKPAQGVEIAQADKRFAQRVTVVPTHTSVQFPNRDKVRHHVYSFSPAKTFEIKLYAGTPANPVVFDRSGIAVLGCNIHDQMVAWVVVVDTPYHGRTDSTGRVRLADVPPGEYRLRTWHPELPTGAPANDQAHMLGAGDSSITVTLPVTAG